MSLRKEALQHQASLVQGTQMVRKEPWGHGTILPRAVKKQGASHRSAYTLFFYFIKKKKKTVLGTDYSK